jgi:hypothetical protein
LIRKSASGWSVVGADASDDVKMIAAYQSPTHSQRITG